MAAHMTCCVSVVEVIESPYWMFSLTAEQTLEPVVGLKPEVISRRQDLPATYRLNGAVYAAGVVWLKEQKALIRPGVAGWVMPAERSLDIDTESDLDRFSQLMSRQAGGGEVARKAGSAG